MCKKVTQRTCKPFATSKGVNISSRLSVWLTFIRDYILHDGWRSSGTDPRAHKPLPLILMDKSEYNSIIMIDSYNEEPAAQVTC